MMPALPGAPLASCKSCEQQQQQQQRRQLRALHDLAHRRDGGRHGGPSCRNMEARKESAAAAACDVHRTAARMFPRSSSSSSPPSCVPAAPLEHAPVPSSFASSSAPGGMVQPSPLMATTRLPYDVGAYRQHLLQSVGPGRYVVGTPTQECQECFARDPRVRLEASGHAKCADRPLVDIDSELHGLLQKATKDPTQQKPAGGFPGTGGCRLASARTCRDEALVSEDTRLSNPPCTLRGTPNGFNRWEAMCKDPQANVELPFDAYISNRLVIKDNHRPVLPKPLDQTPLLPPHCRSDAMLTTMPECGGAAPNTYPLNFAQPCENGY